MKTSSSILTPEQMNEWLEILQFDPITAPRWISTKGPTRLPLPIVQPNRFTSSGRKITASLPSSTSSATMFLSPQDFRLSPRNYCTCLTIGDNRKSGYLAEIGLHARG